MSWFNKHKEKEEDILKYKNQLICPHCKQIVNQLILEHVDEICENSVGRETGFTHGCPNCKKILGTFMEV